MKPPKIKGGGVFGYYDVHLLIFLYHGACSFLMRAVTSSALEGNHGKCSPDFLTCEMPNQEPMRSFFSCDLGCVFWLICKSTTNRLTDLKDLKTW